MAVQPLFHIIRGSSWVDVTTSIGKSARCCGVLGAWLPVCFRSRHLRHACSGMCQRAAKSPKQHASGSSRVSGRGGRYGLLVSTHRQLTPASRGRPGTTQRACSRILDQQLPAWYYSFCFSCGRVFPTTPLVVLHWSIRGSAWCLSRWSGFLLVPRRKDDA